MELSNIEIHQPEEFAKKLQTRRPLRVKYGIDPTAVHIHLGHLVGLLRLREFQRHGHQAVLVIGDFTANVGDPTGRDETRPRLSPEEIEKNARQYLNQIEKVLDLNKTEVVFNSKWLNEINLITLMSNSTIQQILQRDDFSNRMENKQPIYMHECLYPLLQAQDSVEIQADVEIGGSEQLFNFMLARDLMKKHEMEPQVCITVPILRGLDGIKRMGKSLGNYIGLDEDHVEMYAKVMSIPDGLMQEWWDLLKVDDHKFPATLESMNVKKMLAFRIVKFLKNEELALLAQAAWHKRFTLRQDPEDLPEFTLASGQMVISKLLVTVGLAKSNNEARRLIAPNFPKLGNSGVSIGSERTKIEDPGLIVDIENGLIIRVGSRRIIKVIIE